MGDVLPYINTYIFILYFFNFDFLLTYFFGFLAGEKREEALVPKVEPSGHISEYIMLVNVHIRCTY